jgi:hypothetical protein
MMSTNVIRYHFVLWIYIVRMYNQFDQDVYPLELIPERIETIQTNQVYSNIKIHRFTLI